MFATQRAGPECLGSSLSYYNSQYNDFLRINSRIAVGGMLYILSAPRLYVEVGTDAVAVGRRWREMGRHY